MRTGASPVLLLCVLASACGGGTEKATTGPIGSTTASVTVSLESSSVVVGQATQATASARDAGGNVLSGRTIAWASNNALVANVSANGVVTAIAPGTTAITATSDGRTGSATMTVVAPAPAPVAAVAVTVDPALKVGQTSQANAVLTDAAGNVLAGRAIAWTTSDVAVATVSTTGLVTAVSAGSVTITATSESKSGSAQITVAPVGPARLSISMNGAVEAYVGGVKITGPNGFSLDAELTPATPFVLSDVTPGAYTLLAIPLATSIPGGLAFYAPPVADLSKSVTIAAGETKAVSFTYQLSSGVVTIVASGVPSSGGPCGVFFDTPQATGSKGFGIYIGNGQTTKPVTGFGPSQLKCDATIVNGVSYEATPAVQAIMIPASLTPVTASVVYAPPAVPGKLSLTVSGLPSGTTSARISVRGPFNAQATVQVRQDTPSELAGLAPGTYTLTASPVPAVIDGQSVLLAPPPSQVIQTVTVQPGGTTTASFAYVVPGSGS